MKRHFFKTSLSAFTFTLAIVASFAFSPVNGGEDDPVKGYIQVVLPQTCVRVTHNCIKGTEANCTIPVLGGGEIPVLQHTQYTICSNQLTKPY